jgi:hypothetical protein
MRFEAHPCRATRLVSHETGNYETQKGLSCMDEPQRIGLALTGRGGAPNPPFPSTAPPHE